MTNIWREIKILAGERNIWRRVCLFGIFGGKLKYLAGDWNIWREIEIYIWRENEIFGGKLKYLAGDWNIWREIEIYIWRENEIFGGRHLDNKTGHFHIWTLENRTSPKV